MAFEDIKKELEGERKKSVNNRDYPPIWDYKDEGNYIIGKVIRVGEFNGKLVLEIDGEGEEDGKPFKGLRTVFAPTVLDRKLRDLSVKEGDAIGIKQIGTKKGKKWEYYDFRVVKK